MASNRRYTVIGLFLLGAVALFVLAVLTLGGNRIFSNSRQAIVFFDQSVLGLSNGSKVLFRGVQVGTVKDIQLRLDPNVGKARIGVTIGISGNKTVMMNGQATSSDVTTQELVKRGLRAQLVVWSYVTSQLAVNLDFRPDTEPHYAVAPDQLELPEIPGVPSQIEQLKDTVSDLPWRETLDTVNQTMTTMVTLADDMDHLIGTLGPSLKKTSDTTRETLEAARQAIKTSNSQVKQTLQSVQKLSSSLDRQIDSHDAEISRLLDNANKTSRNLQQLSDNLRQLTDPGTATREDIESAIRDLSASAASLRSFAERLERDPNALIFGGS